MTCLSDDACIIVVGWNCHCPKCYIEHSIFIFWCNLYIILYCQLCLKFVKTSGFTADYIQSSIFVLDNAVCFVSFWITFKVQTNCFWVFDCLQVSLFIIQSLLLFIFHICCCDLSHELCSQNIFFLLFSCYFLTSIAVGCYFIYQQHK